MSELWDKLVFYFEFPMVQRAMVVGLLIALCSSLLGVTLVLKRFSFIGDGLSHVAFGAMSAAIVASVLLKGAASGDNSFPMWLAKLLDETNNMIVILPVTLIAAILLLKTGQNTKIKGDAAVAMISVGALAVGYMLINLFSASANVAGDVCGTLFGSQSILTVTDAEMVLCIIMAVLVIGIFVLFYNKIFAVTFDENFAKATGVKADAYNLLIAVITAVIIVLAMNLVGSLLISALIVFPALSAMRVFKSFLKVIICSAVISVICAAAGIVISILFSTPTGSTIVTADIVVFAVFWLVSLGKGKE
ncbi:MAG: metal ABC transporter permease [Ruminococcus sp.]|nr:metal ABC transporter permease [Ruminococcus sp.]